MTAMPAPLRPSDDENDLHWENGILAIPIAKARALLSELANQAAYSKERILLTRRGRKIAAIVPVDDVDTLEELEDSADIAAIEEAEKAGEDDERISLGELRKKLGL